MARILFLSPDLSRNPTYTAWQFAGALSPHHETYVAGPQSGELWGPARGELSVHRVFSSGNPFSPSARAEVLEAADGMDLLYAFKAMPQSLGLASYASARLDIPLAVHLDDWDSGFFRGRPLGARWWNQVRGIFTLSGWPYLRASEVLLRNAAFLTVSSSALRARFGGTAAYQGVDTGRFDPRRTDRSQARARLGVEEGSFVALFLGTPRKHKGLGALRDLADRIRDLRAEVWVIGASPELLEDVGLSDGGGALRLEGVVPFGESAWYLAAADLFILPQDDVPYAHHQVPAKLLQALAMGLPVVATDVGDASMILGVPQRGVRSPDDGPAGLLVPPGDMDALLGAVRGLIGDGERLLSMGRSARKRAVTLYSWNALARAVEPLIQKALTDG